MTCFIPRAAIQPLSNGWRGHVTPGFASEILCACPLTTAEVQSWLQSDLEAKYLVIFQHYGQDLEEVQRLYERHKHAPPLPRNSPPVAGNIMWARQLLRRIEVPMKRWARAPSTKTSSSTRNVPSP